MRIKAIAYLAALFAGLVAGLPAWSQAYPSKPVTIIVPYQAGQGTDVAARLFAEKLGKVLGQQFIVGNKPGAGGNTSVPRTPRARRPTVTRC